MKKFDTKAISLTISIYLFVLGQTLALIFLSSVPIIKIVGVFLLLYTIFVLVHLYKLGKKLEEHNLKVFKNNMDIG